MSRTITAIISLLGLLFVPIAAIAGPSIDATKMELSSNVSAASNTYGAIFSVLAELSPPNSKHVSGHTEIDAFFIGMTNLGLKKMILTNKTIFFDVNKAYDYGLHTTMFRTDDGEIELQGSYHIRWAKNGSNWLIDNFIWTINGE